MFKKALIALAALFISTPAGAQHSFAGSVVGKEMKYGDYHVVPGITYGCNDHNGDYWDLCITVPVLTNRNVVQLIMNANINKELAKAKPNILFRYVVSVAGNQISNVFVRSAFNNARIVRNRTNDAGETVQVNVDHIRTPSGHLVIFSQSSNDGGVTWGDIHYHSQAQ